MKTIFEENSGKVFCGDNVETLKNIIEDSSIDLIVTSPPYDTLREYKEGKNFSNIWNEDKFKELAKELYRVLKDGGVMVWVVGDMTTNGSESLTSFKQAIYFKDIIGFKVHDTMIYAKKGFRNPSSNRYHQIFEYMFIFSKGKPKTFNPIKDRKNKYKKSGSIMVRNKNGKLVKKKKSVDLREYGQRFNIWEYSIGGRSDELSKLLANHPAIFPLDLAKDHIKSWSNEGDVVLDPFLGSGTVAIASKQLKRKYIGIDISQEYCEIAKKALQITNNTSHC